MTDDNSVPFSDPLPTHGERLANLEGQKQAVELLHANWLACRAGWRLPWWVNEQLIRMAREVADLEARHDSAGNVETGHHAAIPASDVV